MKPRYLYHGSSEGNIRVFRPMFPKDLGKGKHNKHKGVYATKLKKWAMIMGILSGLKGPMTINISSKKIQGIVYRDTKLNKKYFYIYKFDSTFFRNLPKGSHQDISFEKIKPIKKQKFLVKDYMKWVREATDKEKEQVEKLIKNKNLK